MTRLISEQIRLIPEGLKNYDLELQAKTGLTLKELAAAAVGVNPDRFDHFDSSVAVIPVTAGLGTIDGFSEAIKAIALHLGFNAFITSSADVSGLVEAYDSNADLIMLADDYKYAAINLNTRRVAENDEATALGYCKALAYMAGGVKGKEVLLIGAGPVGTAAAARLAEAGAKLIVCDLNENREAALAESVRRKSGTLPLRGLTLTEALKRKPLVFDASPGDRIISAAMIDEKTIIASPGIPLGLDSDALAIAGDRLIHDPLQIGTAVMLFTALAG
ncbi:MAG: 3-methylornithyl-N6-L-lysine dehydrogenase PylD [Dethiobacteria bacterium]